MSDFLLGSRVALRCARRAHNDFDPTLSAEELREVPPNRWAEKGIEFEQQVVEMIIQLNRGHVLDLRELHHREAMLATIDAMSGGSSIIVGGALRHDTIHHRMGRPDLLIKLGDRSDGPAGYVPVEIKSHRVMKPSAAGGAQISSLTQIADGIQFEKSPDLEASSAYSQRDLMQLAHYWRMLEASEANAEVNPIGGIIGSDTCSSTHGFIVWQSLTDPLFTTYSRSQKSTKRSALERYDHEFDFRVDVIEVALQQGAPDAPAPLVRPIRIEECDSCPWHDVCLEDLGDTDPSVHITTGRLSVREWNALRLVGIETVTDLSQLSLDDARLTAYWPELEISPRRARSRLETAVIRAQMSLSGEDVRWLDGAVEPIPRADVEVDFDLEWDGENRIYLWGLLVTENGVSRSESLFSWDELNDESEAILAADAISHLERLKSVAQSQDRSFRVYHYSHPEITMIRALLARESESLPSVEFWEEFTSEYFVDLLPRVKERLFGLRGLGLKRVAAAAGFSWDEDEPSGEQTLEWIDQARSDPDDEARQVAQQRLVQYNYDDVRATLAVRRWLESAVPRG